MTKALDADNGNRTTPPLETLAAASIPNTRKKLLRLAAFECERDFNRKNREPEKTVAIVVFFAEMKGKVYVMLQCGRSLTWKDLSRSIDYRVRFLAVIRYTRTLFFPPCCVLPRGTTTLTRVLC